MEIEDNNKLPVEFKTKYLEALRSGKYTQGDGKLLRIFNNHPYYCCIGVGCIVAGLADSSIEEANIVAPPYLSNELCLKVPKALRGDMNNNHIIQNLVLMNDSQGKSFKEIADWIEQNL